ncbi:MAG TPA: HIT domain-containing protein [Thermoanaerobaculales bacterium]|nr:HIT domain-containing protein [Thermoanaerobaculales bacterium]HQL30477.1 HIT domain-containing protein [Thermoanaerobaculales bacterium]
METLFAPWRFEYVTNVDRRDREQCIFCRALVAANDRDTLTLLRSSRCFALLNRYPYTSGHCMVAPNLHVCDFESLDDATLADIMVTAKRLMGALRSAYAPHGFNVGLNVGAAAGAGLAEHLHLHVVPRWRGDTNLMGVIGDTRVIPEELGTTFDKVRAAIDAEERR